MSRAQSCLALLLLTVITAAGAADRSPAFPQAKLDAYFDALDRQKLANGSIAISERGELRYRRSVGFATTGDKGPEPADAGTRYKIGSVTKLFTAALTMQLVEGASITLDSRLAEFYPDLPNALDITYRDLLKHRSGLADYTQDGDFESWRTQPKTHAELLKVITDGGARFAPRERVEYNNSNYLLLGYVLEKVREQSYDEILRRRIVSRIGLLRTYYAGEGIPNLEARSYQFGPGGWVAQADTDPSIHGGAGALVSTPADLVQFIDALFARRLVSAQSLSSMRDQEGGSGMGLWPYTIAGQTGYGHGGRVEGFRACVYHFPDRKLSISYATNASVLSMDEIVDEVLSILFEKGRKPPTFAAVSLTTRQQDDYAGTWRSAAGTPEDTPFRQFTAPDRPIVLEVATGRQGLVGRVQGSDFALIPLGDDEFMIREIGYFLRFYPRRNELVIRGPEWAYYLKRAE